LNKDYQWLAEAESEVQGKRRWVGRKACWK